MAHTGKRTPQPVRHRRARQKADPGPAQARLRWLGRMVWVPFTAVVSVLLVLAGVVPVAYADGTTATPNIAITETQDGQPPFDATAGPGYDTGPNNGVVRANQLITYQVAMSINDPTAPSQTTFQHTTATFAPLPLGFVWDSIPVECTGSNTSLTGDGVTAPSVLVCDFGAKTTGTTWTMNPAIRALRTAVSGTTVAPSATLSATGLAKVGTGTAAGTAISVSSSPKAGITKGNPQGPTADILNGQAASAYFWPFGIHIDDGSDIINGNSFSFTDDLSSLPAGATFKSCGQETFNNLPASFTFKTANGSLAGVPNNGGATWTCTVDPVNPKLVHVTVTGVNTNPSPANCPVVGGDSVTTVPLGLCYVSTWGINVDIPNTSFGSNGVTGTNWVSQLTAVDAAGNPNYAGNPDPGTGLDNTQVAGSSSLVGKQHGWTSILRSVPQSGGNPFPLYKSDFRTTGAGTTPNGTVGSSQWSGDGYVSQGGTYASRNALFFGGIMDLPAGFIMCATIDNAHDIIGSANFGGTVEPAGTTGGPILNAAGLWSVQYGTGGNGGVNSGDGTGWANPTAQQQGSCNNSDSPQWYTSLAQVPGGAGAVTKVRFVLNQTLTVAQQIAAINANQSEVDGWVALQVRATTASGTIIPNYGWATNDPALVTASNPTGTKTSTYDYSTAANGGFGDRVTVTGVRALVSKSSDKLQYLAGQQVTFTLSPVTDPIGANPPGIVSNYTLTDTLPAGLSYIGGSATGSTNYSASCSTTVCAPTVTVNADGTTTLVWTLGSPVAGATLPKITYKVLISATTTAGTNYTNTVVASADNDTSPASLRTASSTININGGASFAVSKSSPTPLTQPGDSKVFNLSFGNLSAVDYASTDFVDWLPFNGDQRAPSSSFGVGSVTLSGAPTVVSGSQSFTFLYSSYPTSQLNMATDTDPATMSSSIVWCTQAQFGTAGCPANFAAVTGIQMQGGTITAHTSTTVQVTMAASGDNNGDLYSNQSTGRVAGLGLPISSNTATVRTVLGSITGEVWNDADRSGLIDNGESGISSVTVQLLDSNGNVVATTTTNSSGVYTFPNLRSGTYSVHVVRPAGMTTTSPQVGSNGNINSKIAIATGSTAPITLAVGQNVQFQNAGFFTYTPAVTVVKNINGVHAPTAGSAVLVPTGSTMNITFVVTNTGNVMLNPVTVTDDQVTNISCPATQLAVGASMTCTATAPAPTTPGGTHVDHATVTGTPLAVDGTRLLDASGNPVANATGTDEAHAFTPAPQLNLVKSASPATVTNVGSVVTYSFVVTNTGNVAVSNLAVAETAFTGTGTASPIVCPVSSLAVGASTTCTSTYPITQADIDAGTVTNTAQATGADPFANPVASNLSTATVTATQSPALSLVKTASPTVVLKAGDTVTYSFQVTNTGNVTVTSLGIGESSFSGTGTLSAVSCPVTSLAPTVSTTCTATYQVTQADVDAGTVVNTAVASGKDPNGKTVNSNPYTATVTATPAPALSLLKTATPGTVAKAGDTVTYSFAVTNTGNVTVSSLAIGETAFSGTGTLSTVNCPVTTLAPGVSTTCTATYAVTQADADAGLVTNTAVASGKSPSGAAVSSNLSSAKVSVPRAPAISLLKSASPAVVSKAGDTVTYSFVVTNTGNVTVNSLTVGETAFTGTGTVSAITCPVTTLAPTVSTTCTATYQVTQADVDAGLVTNTAVANAKDPSGTVVPSNPSTAVVNATNAPKLNLVKSASPGTVSKSGDVVTYSFVVTNAGNVTVSNLAVAETAFSGTGTLSSISCPVTSLAPTVSTTCTASYAVTQADVDAGMVTNTAQATGTDPFSNPVASNLSTAVVTAAQLPGIGVVKSASPNDAAHYTVGQQITYSFVVTNTGNTTLTGVAVQDAAFTGSGVLSAISCPATPLAPTQQLVCTATYVLTQADVDAGKLANTATATGTAPSGAQVVSQPSSVVIPGNPAPALHLEKRVDKLAVHAAGDVLTYTFEITNTGNVTVNNLTVGEDVFTGTGTLGAVSCPVSSLLPGQIVDCTAMYAVTQADVDAGVITNTATATGTAPAGGVVASNQSSAIVTADDSPQITLLKTATPKVVTHAGDQVTYSFQVTNIGNVTVGDLSIQETSFSGTGPITPTSCPATTLAPGASTICTATYAVTQADVDAGTITNTAVATGADPFANAVRSPDSSATVTATQAPAISLVKSASPADAAHYTLGQQVTYSFVVTNTGNTTLTGVAVDDTVFSGSGTLSGISCPATTLAPGQQTTCTATYTLTQADIDAGELTNTATATGTAPGDTRVDSDPSQVKIPGDPAPALTLVKTADTAAIAAAGDTITYRFHVTNTGNVTITDPVVKESTFTGHGTLSPVSCPTGIIVLLPGQSIDCTATYTVVTADLTGAALSNTALVTGTAPDQTITNSSPSTAKVVTPTPPAPSGATVETGGTITTQSPWWWLVTLTGALLLVILIGVWISRKRRENR